MKRFLVILLLILSIFSVRSQSYVFVLVDISKSIKQPDLNGAKLALTNILCGNPLTNATIAYGNALDLAACKLKQGDKLSILKFGDKSTVLANTPLPILVQNIPNDIQQQINSLFPTALTDNNTYYTLARAKVAEYAKNNQIKDYKLYIITDGVEDDYGPNGKPAYSDYERNLVESYGTTSNPITVANSTKVKLNNALNPAYFLDFIPKVDISKYNVPGGSPITPANDSSIAVPTITLTTFADGKKDKPIATKESSFTITWNCNCPPGTNFNVLLSEIDGGGYKEPKKKLTSNSAKFTDVPSGKFKIVVSAANANSAFTFVETPSGNFGWIIFLLILFAAIGVGYYFWNKKRQEKIDVFTSNKTDDIFSGGKNNGSSTNSSPNSDYF